MVVDTTAAAQPEGRAQSCGHHTSYAVRGLQRSWLARALHPPVVGVTEARPIQGKQLLQLAQREVPLHVLLIHHTATQGLLVALTLEDLLLNGSCLGEEGTRDARLRHPCTQGAGKPRD